MTYLANKSIIVTGASRGIGKAAALMLAQHGANLILVARNKDQIKHTTDLITRTGSKAVALAGDVAHYGTMEAAVHLALSRFGKLDGLVNNAGIIDPITRLAESDPDAWSQVVDVNLKGVYHGIRAALPVMQKLGGGTIINISSGAATSALEGWSHYCATKAAVLSLTRCTHREYGHLGIRAVGLSPGTVATDVQHTIRDSGINPVSQLDWSAHIPPEWAAQAIVYLFKPEADDLLGDDFSIKTEDGRARVGLPPLSKSA